MDDSEKGYRGNTDTIGVKEEYGDEDDLTTTEVDRAPDMAAFKASDFGKQELELKAQIARMEAEDFARGQEWTDQKKAVLAEQQAVAMQAQAEADRQAAAARVREATYPAQRPLVQEPSLIVKVGAFLRSLFPSSQRKPS